MAQRCVALTLGVLASLSASTAASAPAPASLADRCAVLTSVATGQAVVAAGARSYRATGAPPLRGMRFHLKPTGLDTFLLHDRDRRLLTVEGDGTTRGDQPGALAEWRIGRRDEHVTLRSTATGRTLAVSPDTGALVTAADAPDRLARFAVRPSAGCTRFPEAELNAAGRPRRAARRGRSVVGLADAHTHLTADLRAGGRVIHGQAFHPFGIAEALGHDEHTHGPQGVLDVTGNLLRTGLPVGTHDTDGWPTFTGWPTHDTNTHQQHYHRWLQRAWLGGLRLIVAQTVEDEPLCRLEPLRSHSCDETETVELQVGRLRELEAYVDAHGGGPGRGWLALVESPREARRAIAGGKLAVLIGVESSNPFGCSLVLGRPQCDRADVDRGIRHLKRLGVRSLFVAHWVDNALAGAALEGGDKGTFISTFQVTSTGTPFATGPCPEPGQGEEGPLGGGRTCNTRGLSELGAYAVRRLMDEHVLIEVDHLSEPARRQVLAIAEERRYPLVSSHTHTGGHWTDGELRRLAALGGLATATVDGAGELPGKVLELEAKVGGPVALATDTGGFATMPGPDSDPSRPGLAYPFRSFDGRVRFDRQRTGRRTFDLNADGMAHYGLLPDLLAHVGQQARGREALAVLFRSAEAYLRMWERTGAR